MKRSGELYVYMAHTTAYLYGVLGKLGQQT